MKNPPSHSILNVGSGTDQPSLKLPVLSWKSWVQRRTRVTFKPDGTPQKLLDVSQELWVRKQNQPFRRFTVNLRQVSKQLEIEKLYV